MYKLPIKSPNKPIITQLYGNTSNNAFYSANGIKNPFHNGIDFVTGTAIQTYGTPLVCPFPEGGYVDDVVYDSPMSTKGNGVYVKSNMINGRQIKIILWHTGEVAVKKGQILNEGDLICYIGNSGLCNPSPTIDNPYAGSHLHFGCYKYLNGQVDYPKVPSVMGEVDGLTIFDKDQWYVGTDSGFMHDMGPAQWLWNKLGITDGWAKFIAILKFWK